MNDFNNYAGHLYYKTPAEERERQMQHSKERIKEDRFSAIGTADEAKEIWEQFNCDKCYERFNCQYKGQGITHVCKERYKDSSEHDKKVWDSAIDDFGNWLAEEGFESSCHNIKCWIKEYKMLKEQKND